MYHFENLINLLESFEVNDLRLFHLALDMDIRTSQSKSRAGRSRMYTSTYNSFIGSS